MFSPCGHAFFTRLRHSKSMSISEYSDEFRVAGADVPDGSTAVAEDVDRTGTDPEGPAPGGRRWLLPAVGLGLIAMLVGTGVMVDWSAVSRARASAEAAAAAAALAAARSPAEAETAAFAVLRDAGASPTSPWRVERGRLEVGSGPATERFVGDPGGDVIRIDLEARVRPPVLGRIGVEHVVSAQALAERVGSVSLELTPRGGQPGPAGELLIGALLGAPVRLREDWSVFARAAVDVDLFLRALERPGETWGEALSQETPVPVALAALAMALPARDEQARLIARRLAESASGSTAVFLPRRLVDLAGADDLPITAPPPKIPQVKAGDLLAALARAAGSGRDTAFSLASPAPGITAIEGVIRLADADGAGFTAVGDLPARFATPGADLTIRVEITGATLPGIAGFVFPLRVAVGAGEVEIRSAACEGIPGVEGAARPAAAELSFVDEAASARAAGPDGAPPVPLVDVPGIRSWIRGTVLLKSGEPTPLRFSAADIAGARSRAIRSPLDVGGLFERLVSATEVLVSADEAAAPPAAVRDEVISLLDDAAPATSEIVTDLLGAIRVSPGAVELVVHDAGCASARLIE